MTDNMLKMVETKYGKAYANALRFTSGAEGSFANHPNDKGLMTYKGIARAYNSKWQGWAIIDKALEQFPELKTPFKKAPVSLSRFNKILNENDELNMLVIDFYFVNYWVKSGAKAVAEYSMKSGIILFDIAVISGVRRAGKTLQKLMNRYYGQKLLVDGIIGRNTLEAFGIANAINEDNMVNNLLLEYQDNLVEASKINGNAVFLNGWINRLTHLRNYLRLL